MQAPSMNSDSCFFLQSQTGFTPGIVFGTAMTHFDRAMRAKKTNPKPNKFQKSYINTPHLLSCLHAHTWWYHGLVQSIKHPPDTGILLRWLGEPTVLLGEGNTGKWSVLSQFSNTQMNKIKWNHSNLIPLSLNEYTVRGHSVRLTKRSRTVYSTGVTGQTRKRLLNPLSAATLHSSYPPVEVLRQDSCRRLKAPLPASDSRMSVSKFNLNWLNEGWQQFCFMDGSTSVALDALLSEIKFLPSPLCLWGCFQLDHSHFSSQSIKAGFATVSQTQPQKSWYGSLVLGQETSVGARHQEA